MLHLTTSWASGGLTTGVPEELSDEHPSPLGRPRRAARASIPDPRWSATGRDAQFDVIGEDRDGDQQALVPGPRR